MRRWIFGAALFACLLASRLAYALQGPAPVQVDAPSFTVRGDANSLTLSADHADVLQVLRALFTQVHKQFVPDSSVVGKVTLLLIHQPFRVVLDAVCHQAFLTYQVDSRGIYWFQQDEQALNQVFARIRLQNGLTQRQLQNMGMLGGVTRIAPLSPNGGLGAKEIAPAVPSAGVHQYIQPMAEPNAPLDARALFLRQHGLVSMNVPRGHPIPVAEVLKSFSMQSGVPIYVDPIIANDPSFKVDGTLTSPLPEALNLLALVAHLSLFEGNGVYFVTTAPDFRVFFGDASTPRASYPPASGSKGNP